MAAKENPDCRLVAVVYPDLSKIKRSELPKIRNSAGEYYYKVSYSLEMSFDTMIHFRLKYKGLNSNPDYQLHLILTDFSLQIRSMKSKRDTLSMIFEAGTSRCDGKRGRFWVGTGIK